ncbi:hypothetical protein HPB51_012729 [Rhipicephalus microplus]|uniref:Uncharacterized protein n=1 Tax=Rhipicephalus microplus TaxID=6941 RepID=A0A9J6E9W9_RHIMP|nr:hypothetical protein HPB51_012729 [Rhipicephalus microplus]
MHSSQDNVCAEAEPMELGVTHLRSPLIAPIKARLPSFEEMLPTMLNLRIATRFYLLVILAALAHSVAKTTERNLTAMREALLREISGVDGTGGASPLRRIQMKKRLRELEKRIADLHSKNQEAQQRFRGFVSAVDSGAIRDEEEAHSALRRVYNFCNTAVAGAVRACRGVFARVRGFFYDKVVGGIANVFHNLIGSRWQSLKAGVNLVAGI